MTSDKLSDYTRDDTLDEFQAAGPFTVWWREWRPYVACADDPIWLQSRGTFLARSTRHGCHGQGQTPDEAISMAFAMDWLNEHRKPNPETVTDDD